MDSLEKLMAMSGKDIFKFLEDSVKAGKTTRAKATRLYAAWLEQHGYFHLHSGGWVKHDTQTSSVARDIGIIVS